MSKIFQTMSNNLVIGRADHHKNNLIVPYIRECISNERNIVVLDSNKSLLKNCGKYLSDLQYSILSIDISNPLEGSLWNPLLVPYGAYQKGDQDSCVNELYNIAAIIMADDIKVRDKDPYWDNAAIDYFVGLSLILFTEADNEYQINIENVYRMAKHGAKKFGANTYIKEYVEQLGSNPYRIDSFLQTIVMAPSETRASIESVFYQRLNAVTGYVSFFNTSNKYSIDIDKLLDKKTAIFISYTEDRTIDLHYVKVFLSQLSHTILKNIKKNRDILPFNYIFSDFLSLGYITEFERMLMSNSKNGNFFLIDIDSLSNAERLYGDNFSEYLISACEGIIIMPSNEIQTLNKVNKLYELLACDKKSYLSPYYLQPDTVLAIVQPNDPKIIQINILDSEVEYEIPKADHELYQVDEFDINEIVKERKKQRLIEMMNESSYDDSETLSKEISFQVQNDDSDELMRIIDQRIEQTKLTENLNRIVNN